MTEPIDNIQEPAIQEVIKDQEQEQSQQEQSQQEQQSQQQLAVELYTLSQAIDKVSGHYEIPFKKISFRFPPIITHGAVVEFVDNNTGAVMAKFSLYLLNSINIDEKSGQLNIPVLFSTMLVGDAMKQRTLDIDLRPKK